MDGRKLGYLIEKGRRDYNGDLAITRWIMTAFFFILAVGIGVTVLQAVVAFIIKFVGGPLVATPLAIFIAYKWLTRKK